MEEEDSSSWVQCGKELEKKQLPSLSVRESC